MKVNGKQKWKSLKTSLFSVAKLKLADFEAHVRAKGATEIAATASTAGTETSMAPSPPPPSRCGGPARPRRTFSLAARRAGQRSPHTTGMSERIPQESARERFAPRFAASLHPIRRCLHEFRFRFPWLDRTEGFHTRFTSSALQPRPSPRPMNKKSQIGRAHV